MKSLDEIRNEIDIADEEIAAAFRKRMQAVKKIAACKKERGLAVFDEAREEELLRRAEKRIEDGELHDYYRLLQRDLMQLSRAYQQKLTGDGRSLSVNLGERSYDMIVERGALSRAGELLDLDRKVLIVTDSGVPAAYFQTVADACREAEILTVEPGEGSKSFTTLQNVLRAMLTMKMTRSDCVVAVGGGVCGDLAGFAASIYMRGVDFYNIPTTLLSQVDASVGGKTAINFEGVKNPVGAFYQPKRVLIDPDVLSTLDVRQFRAGLAEVIKMAATFDAGLFEKIEREPVNGWIDELIVRALKLKRGVVEADEREAGMRKTLNFGHTVGHAIEAKTAPRLLHGECVALGMLPMCGEECRERMRALLKKVGLPTVCPVAPERLTEVILHDKKAASDGIDCVLVEKIGSFKIVRLTEKEIRARIAAAFAEDRL